MTEHRLDNLAGDPSPNPAAAALAALDAPRPRPWKWDEDGADVAGTLAGVRHMADRFQEGQQVLVLELESVGDKPERLLVYCSRTLEKMVAGHSPRMGDGIAIRRGPLVEREDAPKYREWHVAVVPQQGAALFGEQPHAQDPDEPWHLGDL